MIHIIKELDFENYVLILPSVAVGNVGQLAVDLLISNINLEKIGQISNEAFIPVAGLDPYIEDSNEICTTIDLYAEVKTKLLILQIRSPPVSLLTQFFHELENFIVKRKIAKIIVLTSSYAHEKQPDLFKDGEMRYIASPDILVESEHLFDKLRWVKHKPNVTSQTNTEERVIIPGGGFASSLYNYFLNVHIPCVVLFKFCSEGDNIPDAVNLIKYLNSWMKLLQNNSNGELNIEYPLSWKYLFGNPAPSNIY